MSETPLTQKIVLALSSVFGAIVLGTMLISAFAFIVVTSTQMKMAGDAEVLLGRALPDTFHAVTYKEKSLEGQTATHLVIASARPKKGEEPVLVDVYAITGEKIYRQVSSSRPYEVLNMADSLLEETPPTQRLGRWQKSGGASGCAFYLARKHTDVLPMVLLPKFDDVKSRAVILMIAAPAMTRESKPENVQATLARYCDVMKPLIMKDANPS